MPTNPNKSPSNSSLPHEGLTVLELGSSVAAPFAGQILGDLGARVVKIEKPEGDDARTWGPPFVEGTSAVFQALNRNKSSVVCQLRDADQVAILRRFIEAEVDVVLQNLRPGQVEKLGLDAAKLRAIKPSLIYCNMGAFGHKGPLKDQPGYDPLMQAFSGIMSATGESNRASVRVAPSIVDMGTGMWAVIAIQGALCQRQLTGEGSTVDVSLFETAATWMSIIATQAAVTGKAPEKFGSGAASIVPYRAYHTLDGEIVVAAGSDSLFHKLAIALGRTEWSCDKRYAKNPARVLNQASLYSELEKIFAKRKTQEWLDVMEVAGIPAAPVNTVVEMLTHPHTSALGIIQNFSENSVKVLGLPVSYDGIRPAPRCAPPNLGAHTKSVLGTYVKNPMNSL